MSEESASTNPLKGYLTLSVILTAVSQTSFLLYYKQFGLQPLQFYEPAELIVNSSKDFVVISVLVYFYMAILTGIFMYKSGLHNHHIGLDQKKIILQREKPAPVKFSKFNAWVQKNGVLVLIGQIVIIAALITSITFFSKDKLSVILLSMLWGPAILLLNYIITQNYNMMQKIKVLNPEYFKRLTVTLPIINPGLFSLVVLFLMIIGFLATFKADRALKNNKYIGSLFTLTNETVKITKTALLIGRSKEFLFIYNTPDSSIRILKRSDLVKEVIKINDDSLLGMITASY